MDNGPAGGTVVVFRVENRFVRLIITDTTGSATTQRAVQLAGIIGKRLGVETKTVK